MQQSTAEERPQDSESFSFSLYYIAPETSSRRVEPNRVINQPNYGFKSPTLSCTAKIMHC